MRPAELIDASRVSTNRPEPSATGGRLSRRHYSPLAVLPNGEPFDGFRARDVVTGPESVEGSDVRPDGFRARDVVMGPESVEGSDVRPDGFRARDVVMGPELVEGPGERP